jgi:hypothetical protein
VAVIEIRVDRKGDLRYNYLILLIFEDPQDENDREAQQGAPSCKIITWKF